MQEEAVRSVTQGAEYFFVFRDHRASGDISAGHDKGIRAAVCPVQKEHVERCVGQHDPEAGAETQFREASLVLLGEEDNGMCRACQESLFGSAETADAAYRFQ